MHTLESFQLCPRVIGVTSLRHTIGSQKLASLFHPIRRKTKASGDSIGHIFPRFESAMFNYWEFWLVHCCVFYNWLEWFLWCWFWFYDSNGWIRISLVSVTFLICISGEVVKKFACNENVTKLTQKFVTTNETYIYMLLKGARLQQKNTKFASNWRKPENSS